MKNILFAFLLLAGAQLSAQPDIQTIEYWIDGDPGIGMATQLATNSPTLILQSVQAINASLLPGRHVLGIRSKDANRKWSQTNHISFIVSAVPTPTDIVAVEYFWDADPGYGNGIQSSDFPAGSDIIALLSNTITSLMATPDNRHVLFVRTRDSQNHYSQTNHVSEIELGVKDFKETGISVYPNPVTDQLNIDIEKGGTSRVIICDASGHTVTDTVISNAAKIDMSQLPSGMYTACFWKDANTMYVVKLLKK